MFLEGLLSARGSMAATRLDKEACCGCSGAWMMTMVLSAARMESSWRTDELGVLPGFVRERSGLLKIERAVVTSPVP